MEKNTGKVREFYHPGKVGTLFCNDAQLVKLFSPCTLGNAYIELCYNEQISLYQNH